MDWLLVATAVRLVTAVGSVHIQEKRTFMAMYTPLVFMCNVKLTNC